MQLNWNSILEAAIFGKLIFTLVEENGFRVEICDQDGGGLHVYAVPDAGEKPKGGFEYWVKLVPGNEPDTFISDYTTNLQEILKPVFDFANVWGR